MTNRIASVLLLFALVFAATVVYLIPAAQALCIPTYGAGNVQAIAEGNNLYVLWEYGAWNPGGSSGDSSSGDHYLQFKRSTDAGKTFGETVNIHHANPNCGLFPRMAVDGNNLYIMWQDNGVLLRASNDNGASFGETITLGDGWIGSKGYPSAYEDGGQVIARDGKVYAIWQSDTDGNILFRKSDDAGSTFGTLAKLNEINDSYRPKMTVSGSNVYATWTEGYTCTEQPKPACQSKVMFVKSIDYGQTFSKPVSFESLTGDSLSTPVVLDMAADDKYVNVLWREGGFLANEDSNYYLSGSNDEGLSFSAKVALLTADDYEFTYITDLTAIGDTAYALKRSRDDAVAIKSVDGGSPISAQIPIPVKFPTSEGRFVLRDKDHAYLLLPMYSEKDVRVLVVSAREGSVSPSQVELLRRDYAPDSSSSEFLMGASGDIVHVLWVDSTGPQSDYEQQIVVRTSTDAGKSFGDSVQLANMVTVPEFGSIATGFMAAGIVGSIVLVRRLQDRHKS